MKKLLVKDWMTKNPITADPNMGMLGAHKLMRANKIRRLPIVNKRRELVGIVTRSDLRGAEPSDASTLNIWEMNYLLAQLKLKEMMTRDNLIVCRADDTIRTAATFLYDNRIGALPVIDDREKVIGIITESDIFRILISWFNEEVGG